MLVMYRLVGIDEKRSGDAGGGRNHANGEGGVKKGLEYARRKRRQEKDWLGEE